MTRQSGQAFIQQWQREGYILLILASLLLGVLFLSQSYAFYNINHYKLVAALVGAGILSLVAVLNRIIASQRKVPQTRQVNSTGISRLAFVLLLLPVIATLPGYFLTEGRFAYFFAQEIVIWLVCCCWLFLVACLFHHTTHIKYLVAGLALLVLMSSWIAIFNYGELDTGFSLDVLERESGAFGNPDYLAGYLCLQLPLLLICALPSVDFGLRGRSALAARLLFATAAISGTVALILTQARTAQLVFAACLLLLFIAMYCRPAQFGISRGALQRTAAVAVLIGIAVLWVFPVLEYINERMRLGSTPDSRLVPWSAAWASIREAPWLGWGSGSSYSLFFQFVDAGSRLDWFQRRYVHPHNEYLEILQEGGVLALSAYLILLSYLGSLIYRLLHSSQLDAQYKLVLFGVGLGIISYHLLAIVSVAPRMISVRLIFFILIALVLQIHHNQYAGKKVLQSSDARTPASFWTKSISARAMLACVFSLLVICSVLYYPVGVSRFEYVNILRNTSGQEQTVRLQALRNSHPNVYALETLISQELLVGDIQSAQHSIAIMDELIPNYDNVGYLKAVVAVLQNDQSAARATAEAYQARDLYHANTALLLAKIALLSRDAELLQSQLRLILLPLLAAQPELGLTDAEDFQLLIEGLDVAVVASSMGDHSEITLRIGAAAYQSLLELGRLALIQADATAPQQYQSVIEFLAGNMRFAGLSAAQELMIVTLLEETLATLVSRII